MWSFCTKVDWVHDRAEAHGGAVNADGSSANAASAEAPTDDGGEAPAAQKSKQPRSIAFAKMPPRARRRWIAFCARPCLERVGGPFSGGLLLVGQFILPPPHPSVKEIHCSSDQIAQSETETPVITFGFEGLSSSANVRVSNSKKKASRGN